MESFRLVWIIRANHSHESDGMSAADGQELLKDVDPEYILSLITKDKEEKAREADKKAAAAEKRREKRKAAVVPTVDTPTTKRPRGIQLY